eukprot:14725757-Alexandrium_andersonii.AAC.1
MSASLVGSEMCIRDRSSSRAACRSTWSMPWPAGRTAGGMPAIRLTPVSYTHLTLPTICSV